MSSAPGPESDGSEGWNQLLDTEGTMILSSIMVVVIMILTTFSRRSTNRFIHGSLTILSALYIPIITYAMDDYASNLDTPSPLLIVSGALLQIIISKATPRNVRLALQRGRDDDNSNSDDSPIENLTSIGWFIFLLFNNYYYVITPSENHSVRKDLTIPTCLLLVLSSFKVVHNKVASVLATRSFRVGKNTEVVAAYMEKLRQNVNDRDGNCCDLYLILGEEKQKIEITAAGYSFETTKEEDLITVNKVRTCKGGLLHENEKNREICLSFALFKLLKLSIAEQPRAEHNALSWNLVDHELFKDPFPVVERELKFMDDYLHSPLPFTFFSWFAVSNILLSSLFLGCCSYIGFHVLHGVICHNSYLHHVYSHDTDLGQNQRGLLLWLDVIVCLLILFVTGLMETYEISRYLFSDHARIVLLCKYVKNQEKRPFTCKVIEFFYPNLRSSRKLWSNKLRQYSLMKAKEESTVKLPEEIKEAVIESLRNFISQSSSANVSSSLLSTSEQCILRTLGALRALGAFKLEYGYVERILVWHIATTRCEVHYSSCHPNEEESIFSRFWRKCLRKQPENPYLNSDHKVASCLSRYCAYLVVSAPELLPDNVTWTQCFVKGVKEQIKQRAVDNKSGSSPGNTVRKLKKLMPGFAEYSKNNNIEQVYDEGEKIGMNLIEGMTSEENRWKFLANWWAEILLSVAPSNQVNAHTENIKKGGEFITHVWALLSNVGINDNQMIADALAQLYRDDSV